ncbi:hypothetical protein GCM10029976_018510 [Kribbella albertanoniae]|uniref:Inhibitor I9 domain-containing protein n=1 Tax=Kribbella albertanoniae TaxID=1266829 RepID=A0A4V2XRQ7_9ACTN|nr:hypothetical protein [Kribbella albertanoniae]TDC30845.1 hypothetical protein E1261_12430 [Kribbella albertanoniae]
MGWIRCGLFAAGLLIVASCTTGTGSSPSAPPSAVPDVRVIVTLAGDFRPEGELGDQARRAQRTAIRAAQDAVLAELPAAGVQVNRRYDAVPQLALSVDATALDLLRRSPRVAAVQEDTAQSQSG